RIPRVAVVVMENREYSDLIGSGAAPYVNKLATRYALATQFYAVSHPSLPNYLALLGGSTFGITSDCTSCSVNSENLVDQLSRRGISWRAYMEGLPSPCYEGDYSGEYAKKHDPFMYFDSIANNPKRCSHVVPFTKLHADIVNHRVPRLAWISPNLCHDGHDCTTAAADGFLHRHLPALISALGPGGVLFLTWDEGDTDAGCCSLAAGGRVVTIVAGPGARRGLAATNS